MHRAHDTGGRPSALELRVLAAARRGGATAAIFDSVSRESRWREVILAGGCAVVTACSSPSDGNSAGDASGDASGASGDASGSFDATDAPTGDATAVGDGAVDAEAGSSGCASRNDCLNGPFPAGLGVWCCIDRTCIYGQSAIDAVACTDANTQPIQSSNYDQSCQTDGDCIAVAEGNLCVPSATFCPLSGAINKSAYTRYQADVAKTNAAICGAVGSCGASLGPCCRSGTCQTGNPCGVVQPSDAATDSGDASRE